MLPPETVKLAAPQCGLFSNRDAIEAGYGSWDLTRWLRAGLIERVVMGWYRIAGAPVPEFHHLHVSEHYLAHRQRNCETQPEGEPAALLTGGQALEFVGAIDEAPSRRPMALIDTTRQVRLREPPFDVLRTELALEGYWLHGHLHLALPPRMIGDYGGEEGVTDLALRTAFDRLRYVTPIDMLEAVKVWARRHGVGFTRLNEMALDGVFEQESEAERQLFNGVLAKTGVLPDCQVWLTPRIRVDFAYLFAGLVLEYHGEQAHRDRVDEDSTRQFKLRQLGQDVLVVTKSMAADPNLLPYVIELQHRGEAEIAAGRRPVPQPLDRPRLFPLRTMR